jgi:hypothetical protein
LKEIMDQAMRLDHSKPFPQTVSGDDGEVIGCAHKFTNLDELQSAMVELTAIANSQTLPPKWFFAPTSLRDTSDPLGQTGYVALRVKD